MCSIHSMEKVRFEWSEKDTRKFSESLSVITVRFIWSTAINIIILLFIPSLITFSIFPFLLDSYPHMWIYLMCSTHSAQQYLHLNDIYILLCYFTPRIYDAYLAIFLFLLCTHGNRNGSQAIKYFLLIWLVLCIRREANDG